MNEFERTRERVQDDILRLYGLPPALFGLKRAPVRKRLWWALGRWWFG